MSEELLFYVALSKMKWYMYIKKEMDGYKLYECRVIYYSNELF